MDLRSPALNALLDQWLSEDLGRGDLTSVALGTSLGKACWMAKQPGIFCGGLLTQKIYQRLDPLVIVKLLVCDGDQLSEGQKVLELEGPAGALVAGERTALNLAMRLSGIATATARLVTELEGTGTRLCDTRKTTPGLRIFEKYAIRCGGGLNHRFGLDDAAMLKENHLAWAGGIEPAVRTVKAASPWPSKIIVEVETEQEAYEAVKVGVDGLLLDNFSSELLKSLVPRLRKLAKAGSLNGASGQIILEASGVKPIDIKAFAHTGVDLISTSAPITKSAWLDLSMRFENSL